MTTILSPSRPSAPVTQLSTMRFLVASIARRVLAEFRHPGAADTSGSLLPVPRRTSLFKRTWWIMIIVSASARLIAIEAEAVREARLECGPCPRRPRLYRPASEFCPRSTTAVHAAAFEHGRFPARQP